MTSLPLTASMRLKRDTIMEERPDTIGKRIAEQPYGAREAHSESLLNWAEAALEWIWSGLRRDELDHLVVPVISACASA